MFKSICHPACGTLYFCLCSYIPFLFRMSVESYLSSDSAAFIYTAVKTSLCQHHRIVIFTQPGIESWTTIDFTKSTNHDYRNLDALKQILAKRDRIELLQDDGCQRAKKQKPCSKCSVTGHNKCTCKNDS